MKQMYSLWFNAFDGNRVLLILQVREQMLSGILSDINNAFYNVDRVLKPSLEKVLN